MWSNRGVPSAQGETISGMQFVVLSGPSGVGKTTVVERLLADCPVRLVKSVSATTRAPRKNERDGVDYYFLSPGEFQERRERGEFLECAEVHGTGNWYGTLKAEIERARQSDACALLEIDVQGAHSIVAQYPQALTIFLTTPSDLDYERRLRERATESEAVIQRRLATARHELEHAAEYRYRVVNDHLDRAVREIIEIITAWEAKNQ